MQIESTEGHKTNKAKPRIRRTPTERQVEKLCDLNDEEIVARALQAMHALNRRAKEIRDRRNSYRRATFARALRSEMDDIYALKDSFLEALVAAGRATVGSFTVTVENGEMYCTRCGRTWSGDTWCYTCDASTGISLEDERIWYVIECGEGYRFHQPRVSASVAAKAVPIPPHDPTQPQRQIPNVGLTIEAQKACVRLATERLSPSGEESSASSETAPRVETASEDDAGFTASCG